MEIQGEHDDLQKKCDCPVPIFVKRKHATDTSYIRIFKVPICLLPVAKRYQKMRIKVIETCISPAVLDKDLSIDLFIYLSVCRI